MPAPILIPTHRLSETASTSLDARERIGSAESSFWVVAETQTAGRGREGRAWASPAGGLWATLAWPLSVSPDGVLDGLGQRIGVALTESVRTFCPRARLKHPNDVLIDGAKVAGVLTEIVDGWALVGCGVNVANEAPVLDPPARATSLRDHASPVPTPDDVLLELSRRLIGSLTRTGDDADLASALERA